MQGVRALCYVANLHTTVGSKGQILYLWDELLWIGGFALIEKNIFEWRARLVERPT